MPAKWIAWSQVGGLIQPDDAVRVVGLIERLVAAATEATSVNDFLRQQLAEVAGELGVSGSGVMDRRPEWTVLGQSGRWSGTDAPKHVFADVLDKDAGVIVPMEGSAGVSMAAVPIRARSLTGAALSFTARNLPEDVLPLAMLLGKAMGACLDVIADRRGSAEQIDRLRSILKISRSLSTVKETEPLLVLIAREAVRLLDCDRASIFLWDREHQEVIACPALGVEGNSLRLPDKTGIVGEVIHTAKPLRIDDAYHDSRFSKKVDLASGYKTRNLLCAPLFDGEHKLLGAFEVINKNSGTFADGDVSTLEDLATQVGIALHNTRERESLLRSHRQLTEQVTKGVSLIGDSPAMQAMRSTISRLAATDLPVLILGESGTGKEVVAQSLHYQGPRADPSWCKSN